MAEPPPRFNVTLDREMEVQMHDPDGGRMPHWYRHAAQPLRVAHLTELTNEELCNNVKGTFWVLNKKSADDPAFGYTPFDRAHRMVGGVLKFRILTSSSSKGGTYYSRGGILSYVKAAYWGVLGAQRPQERAGIFSPPQGGSMPVVTLVDGTAGAHIQKLMLWTGSDAGTLVEPIAALARAKAPAVFFTVNINFPNERNRNL